MKGAYEKERAAACAARSSRYRVGHGLQKPFEPQRLVHYLGVELDRGREAPRPRPRHQEQAQSERNVEQGQQGAGDDLVVDRAGREADTGDDAGHREGDRHREAGDQQVGRADLEVLSLDAHHQQADPGAHPEADGLEDGEHGIHPVGDRAGCGEGDARHAEPEDPHEDLRRPLEELLEVLGHVLVHHPRQDQERQGLLGVREVERGPGRGEDEQVLQDAGAVKDPQEQGDSDRRPIADAESHEVDVRAADGDQHQDPPDVIRDGRSHHEHPHGPRDGKQGE